MKRQTDNVLFEISVMADNAKNLLGMVLCQDLVQVKMRNFSPF